jgi:hypothetical protein
MNASCAVIAAPWEQQQQVEQRALGSPGPCVGLGCSNQRQHRGSTRRDGGSTRAKVSAGCAECWLLQLLAAHQGHTCNMVCNQGHTGNMACNQDEGHATNTVTVWTEQHCKLPLSCTAQSRAATAPRSLPMHVISADTQGINQQGGYTGTGKCRQQQVNN